MIQTPVLQQWAREAIVQHAQSGSEALEAYCAKPSAKRLHRARKALARLCASLTDLAVLAEIPTEYRECVAELHRRAGKVRDADVLIARIDEYLEGSAGAEKVELCLLRDALRVRRKRARRKLRRLLRSAGEIAL